MSSVLFQDDPQNWSDLDLEYEIRGSINRLLLKIQEGDKEAIEFIIDTFCDQPNHFWQQLAANMLMDDPCQQGFHVNAAVTNPIRRQIEKTLLQVNKMEIYTELNAIRYRHKDAPLWRVQKRMEAYVHYFWPELDPVQVVKEYFQSNFWRN